MIKNWTQGPRLSTPFGMTNQFIIMKKCPVSSMTTYLCVQSSRACHSDKWKWCLYSLGENSKAKLAKSILKSLAFKFPILQVNISIISICPNGLHGWIGHRGK